MTFVAPIVGGVVMVVLAGESVTGLFRGIDFLWRSDAETHVWRHLAPGAIGCALTLAALVFIWRNRDILAKATDVKARHSAPATGFDQRSNSTGPVPAIVPPLNSAEEAFVRADTSPPSFASEPATWNERPRIDVHAPGGQVAVGDHNVLHQTVTGGRLEVPQSLRDQLISALRLLPPHRFSVLTGVGGDSRDIGVALSADLSMAGWTWVDSGVPEIPRYDWMTEEEMPKPRQPPPGGYPIGAVDQQTPTPPRRGVTLLVKGPNSSALDVLARWCRAAGLQPSEVAFQTPYKSQTPDAYILVGDPP